MTAIIRFKYFSVIFASATLFLITLKQGVASNYPRYKNHSDTLGIAPPFSPINEYSSPEQIPDTLNLNLSETILPGQPLSNENFSETEQSRGSSPLLESKVEYSAHDSIFFDVRNQKVYLFGNADIKYQELHLKAGYVEIDLKTKTLFARGIEDRFGVERQKPQFSDGKQNFTSRQMWYNFETKRGRTLNMFTAENDGFLHGEIVKIEADRTIFVQGGKFTTCDCPDPHFHIGFSKAKVLPDERIITSMANLVIMGVPTPLVLPFGFFPKTQKQSRGLLFPSFGEDANRGFYLQGLGFYTPINDYWDLSIRTDLFSRGSWAATFGTNYRRLYKHSGSINLSYAENVQGGRGLPDYSKAKDFRISWNHSQDAKAQPNSTFRASVNFGTSRISRFNPMSDDDYLNNNRSSSISYQRRIAEGKINFSANFRASQNSRTARTDLTLPDISLSVARFNPFKRRIRVGDEKWYESITVNYSMSARNEIQAPDSTLFSNETLKTMRSGISHHIPINHSTRLLKHFNFSNNVDYRMNMYFTSIERRWDPNATIQQGGQTIAGAVVTDTIRGFKTSHDISYSATLGTTAYGIIQFAKGPVAALRHVLTPNISFVYRPDYSLPFWGYNRRVYNERTERFEDYSIFAGQLFPAPGTGRAGGLNFSISNNLEMKLRGKQDSIPKPDRKIKLIDNLTISGGYDFMKDSLNWSDISLSGRTVLPILGDLDLMFFSSWSVYDTDKTGRILNQFVWNTRKKPFMLRNSSWSTGIYKTFSSGGRSGQMRRGMEQMPGRPGMRQAGSGFDNGGPDGANLFGVDNSNAGIGAPVLPPSPKIDFSVAWTFSFNYTLRYETRYVPEKENFERQIVQTLGFNGDINLTKNWRLAFRSGWDFEAMKLTYTSIDVYRDLHCWEMSFNWIPFGFRKSYNFSIRVKNPLLKDLKYEKRTHHLDRAFSTF